MFFKAFLVNLVKRWLQVTVWLAYILAF